MIRTCLAATEKGITLSLKAHLHPQGRRIDERGTRPGRRNPRSFVARSGVRAL